MGKITKRKSELRTCDDLWSKIVKIRAGYKCEYCGKTSYLNSHHIFSRNNYSTRFDLDNGICLCAGHHTFSRQFSAHQTPIEFAEWIRKKRGDNWYESLRFKARKLRNKNYSEVEKYLLKELDKYEKPQ